MTKSSKPVRPRALTRVNGVWARPIRKPPWGLVAAGLGYAIAPLSLADFWGSRICLRPAQDLTIPFTMELVWLAQRADPLVDHFLERWRAACAS